MPTRLVAVAMFQRVGTRLFGLTSVRPKNLMLPRQEVRSEQEKNNTLLQSGDHNDDISKPSHVPANQPCREALVEHTGTYLDFTQIGRRVTVDC